jgi:hypothetical protein
MDKLVLMTITESALGDADEAALAAMLEVPVTAGFNKRRYVYSLWYWYIKRGQPRRIP